MVHIFVCLQVLKNMFVYCLPNHNFQTGSVGRKRIFFFFSLSKKNTLFLGKTVIKRSKKKIFFFRWPNTIIG